MKARLSTILGLTLLGACGGSSQEAEFTSKPNQVQAKRLADGSIDDQSRCEHRAREDREAVETAGPGSIMPNVRRVFAVVGQGTDRQRVLVCREIDTNLDGVKDVFRKYNDKGEAVFEEADANYDGKIDTWLTFTKGGLAESRLDVDYNGNPDEWKYYSAGKLSRAKRDTNGDGKADVWEIYGPNGRLERMGVDVDHDERVDRWDYDNEVRRSREDKERQEEEAAADAAAKKAAEEKAAGEYRTAEETEDDPAIKKKDNRPASKKKGATPPAPEPPKQP